MKAFSHLPDEERVYEPEIVHPGGSDRRTARPSNLRVWLAHSARVLKVACFGFVCIAGGLILTFTIVGAFVGIPLIFFGGLLVLLATFLLIGGSKYGR